MEAKFQVLITDRAWPDADVERRILGEIGAEVIEPPATDEVTLAECAKNVDAIATCWAAVTSQVIRAAPRCRVVSRLGIGLDNIAVDTATELGIPVTNVPDYCLHEVAEHTLALLLACARNIAFFRGRTLTGEYSLQAAPLMHRVDGKVLGLFGLGRIGRLVAMKARSLGLETIGYSRTGNAGCTGCRMVSFDQLLAESDFLSLHAPLNPETHHRFRLQQFERMKRSCFLINTSRGGLIDHNDLWSALRQNRIAGAALDVFEPEPPDLSLPLFRDERVLVTPHAAFYSAESVEELRTRAAHQIASILTGARPENVVNPQVFDRPK